MLISINVHKLKRSEKPTLATLLNITLEGTVGDQRVQLRDRLNQLTGNTPVTVTLPEGAGTTNVTLDAFIDSSEKNRNLVTTHGEETSKKSSSDTDTIHDFSWLKRLLETNENLLNSEKRKKAVPTAPTAAAAPAPSTSSNHDRTSGGGTGSAVASPASARAIAEDPTPTPRQPVKPASAPSSVPKTTASVVHEAPPETAEAEADTATRSTSPAVEEAPSDASARTSTPTPYTVREPDDSDYESDEEGDNQDYTTRLNFNSTEELMNDPRVQALIKSEAAKQAASSSSGLGILATVRNIVGAGDSWIGMAQSALTMYKGPESAKQAAAALKGLCATGVALGTYQSLSRTIGIADFFIGILGGWNTLLAIFVIFGALKYYDKLPTPAASPLGSMPGMTAEMGAGGGMPDMTKMPGMAEMMREMQTAQQKESEAATAGVGETPRARPTDFFAGGGTPAALREQMAKMAAAHDELRQRQGKTPR